MSKRTTYKAEVTGFSVDNETQKELINFANVTDSDGELIAGEMDLFCGSWSSGLQKGAKVSFSAKLTSRVQRQFIEDRWYNVREGFLCDPKLIE